MGHDAARAIRCATMLASVYSRLWRTCAGVALLDASTVPPLSAGRGSAARQPLICGTDLMTKKQELVTGASEPLAPLPGTTATTSGASAIGATTGFDSGGREENGHETCEAPTIARTRHVSARQATQSSSCGSWSLCCSSPGRGSLRFEADDQGQRKFDGS